VKSTARGAVRAIDIAGPWIVQGQPENQYYLTFRPEGTYGMKYAGVVSEGMFTLNGDTVTLINTNGDRRQAQLHHGRRDDAGQARGRGHLDQGLIIPGDAGTPSIGQPQPFATDHVRNPGASAEPTRHRASPLTKSDALIGSLGSIQLKLIKIEAKVVSHSRRTVFQMAEVAVPEKLFRSILSIIHRLGRACARAPALNL
jgi:hypothetical protein